MLLLDATYIYPDLVNSYRWNTGSSDPVISVTENGLYIVNINMDCDTLSDSVNVTFNDVAFYVGK